MYRYKAAIITMSDKASQGERVDKSHEEIKIVIAELGYELAHYVIIPDEKDLLLRQFNMCVEDLGIDIIFTTGGTGIGPRDITPDATLDFIDKELPGIPEYIRMKTSATTPRSILSRAVAGVKNKTMILNLPGSPKGVHESLHSVKHVLTHALGILTGRENECGNEPQK